MLAGPLHWLGLADIGDDALRLTAYGRAFFGISAWPAPHEPSASIEARADGALLVSRRVSRFERFQLARFAQCTESSDPYVYRIDAAAIQRASAQGITVQQIHAFLARHLDGDGLPLPLLKLLRNWHGGAKASVTLETMMVLRATSEEILDKLFAAPGLRRYLGARLGAIACAVRADQWQALRDALGANGIEVDSSQMTMNGD